MHRHLAQPPNAEEPRLCCMCGDVGFSEDLLACPSCCSRLQHTYCSKMYPNLDMERWRCEWCIYSDQQRQQQQTQVKDGVAAEATKKHRGGKRVALRLSTGAGDGSAAASPRPSPKKPRQHRRGDEGSPSPSPSPAPKTATRPGCSLPSPRRRYKLLADVHC